MYGRGRSEHIIEHQATRHYLMYDAINDTRTRPTHLAMDGYVAPIGSPIWNQWNPPCGYRCRCNLISLSPRQAAKYQAADNKKLLANPNAVNNRLNAVINNKDNFHSPLTAAIDDNLKSVAEKYRGSVFDGYLRNQGLIV